MSNDEGSKVSARELPRYVEGVRIPSTDSPTGFGKVTSVIGSQQAFLAPEISISHLKSLPRSFSHDYEIPDGAIRVDNHVTIDREVVSGKIRQT